MEPTIYKPSNQPQKSQLKTFRFATKAFASPSESCNGSSTLEGQKHQRTVTSGLDSAKLRLRSNHGALAADLLLLRGLLEFCFPNVAVRSAKEDGMQSCKAPSLWATRRGTLVGGGASHHAVAWGRAREYTAMRTQRGFMLLFYFWWCRSRMRQVPKTGPKHQSGV